jgi:hypothetical protein
MRRRDFIAGLGVAVWPFAGLLAPVRVLGASILED